MSPVLVTNPLSNLSVSYRECDTAVACFSTDMIPYNDRAVYSCKVEG